MTLNECGAVVLIKTDMGRFVELYRSFGIKLEIEAPEDGLCDFDGSPIKNAKFAIILKEGYSPKFLGYTDFFSRVVFDDKGKFIAQGFWE